jgi:hypothetical protein
MPCSNAQSRECGSGSGVWIWCDAAARSGILLFAHVRNQGNLVGLKTRCSTARSGARCWASYPDRILAGDIAFATKELRSGGVSKHMQRPLERHSRLYTAPIRRRLAYHAPCIATTTGTPRFANRLTGHLDLRKQPYFCHPTDSSSTGLIVPSAKRGAVEPCYHFLIERFASDPATGGCILLQTAGL